MWSCVYVGNVSDSSATTFQLIHISRYPPAEQVIPEKHRKIFPTERFHTFEKRVPEIGHCYKESHTRKMTKSGTRIALLGLSGDCNPIMMIRTQHMLAIAKKISLHSACMTRDLHKSKGMSTGYVHRVCLQGMSLSGYVHKVCPCRSTRVCRHMRYE